MTQHFFSRQLRFFMTASAPCPYLPGQFERKVFANLPFSDGADVNDALTQAEQKVQILPLQSARFC